MGLKAIKMYAWHVGADVNLVCLMLQTFFSSSFFYRYCDWAISSSLSDARDFTASWRKQK